MTLGYNVYITCGTNRLVGVTQDDLTLTTNVKESITKDDAGVKQKVVTGNSATFKVSGIMKLDGNKLDVDELIALAQNTSDNDFNIKYFRSDGANYVGNAIMTGYTESTQADPEADAIYTVDFELAGGLSKSNT